MRVAIGLGERNPTELISRLFDIKPAKDDAAIKEAQAALLRANPHLDFKNGVPEGALIIVPEIVGITPTEEAKPVGSDTGEMVTEVRLALGGLGTKLHASAVRHEQEANATLQLLKSSEVKTAIERSPESKARGSAIADQAKAKREEAKNLQMFKDQVLTQLENDLKDLAKRFSQVGTASPTGPQK